MKRFFESWLQSWWRTSLWLFAAAVMSFVVDWVATEEMDVRAIHVIICVLLVGLHVRLGYGEER